MKLILLLLFILGGCASFSSRETDRLVKKPGNIPEKSKLAVPFVKQKAYHCGPATLSMAMSAHGRVFQQDIFYPKLKGTFQADMLSSARREGMLTIPVGDMRALFRETSAGRPVIVFQNLGLALMPQWHYALVVGHNLKGPDIILHSGEDAYSKTDMRFFERTWRLGGNWGLLLLKPGELSVTGSERAHLESAAWLENAGKTPEAQISYEAILTRWPRSLGARLGLGNVYYAQKRFQASEEQLLVAVKDHPDSALAWHNLTVAQAALKKTAAAKRSAKKAIETADAINRERFRLSLSPWLVSRE